MNFRPVKLYWGWGMSGSAAFEGGTSRRSALSFRVPLTFGVLAQPPFAMKAGWPPVSTLAPGGGPGGGEPQTSTLSFVWNGPFTTSWLANWMVAQPAGRVGLAQR